jgi:peptidylprolyl isomerase
MLVAGLALGACRVPPPLPQLSPLPAPIPPLAGAERIILALRYIEASIGTGADVVQKQCVFVHYTGWLTNGTKFDSSRDTMPNGQPRTPIGFPLGFRRVIAGWDLGFDGMKVGGKRRLFIPYPLAYGDAGRPPVIPAKSELIFDLDVVAVADTLSGSESAPQRGPSPQCPTWNVVKARTAPGP